MSERVFEDSIAELLRKERARYGISLDSVADHSCVSVPAAFKWETGDTRPSSFWRLKRWAEAVEVKLEIKATTKDGVEFTF